MKLNRNKPWSAPYSPYALRLANPIKPIRPEPNNHAVAGTGTAFTSALELKGSE